MSETHHLIIDADDTLWENNIYFEQAFDRFVEYLAHPRLTSSQVRDSLDDIERVNSKLHGYGSVNFGRNMVQTFGALAERTATDADRVAIEDIAVDLLSHPMVLIEGVVETLERLAGIHDLTMFTKGDPVEQRRKIDASGLAHHFDHIEIVKEKDRAAYLDLAGRRRFNHERAWMVGNSPKSDINPALAAGLNAVYVPHARTWVLEREEIRNEGTGRLLLLTRFAELAEHF